MKLQTLVTIFAVLMAFSAVGFAFSDATDDYTVTKELFKPLLVGIQATPVSASVNIQLFNVNSTVIASGQNQVNIYANSTLHVNVPLEWTENKTIVNYAGGLVTVS